MQGNRVLKELAVIKESATIRNGSIMAFLTELLPRDTGLDEVVYQLSIGFAKKSTQKLNFRRAENAITYLNEYLERNAPQKGFVFFNRTGLKD